MNSTNPNESEPHFSSRLTQGKGEITVGSQVISLPEAPPNIDRVVFSVFRDTSASPSGKSMTLGDDGSLIKKTHGVRGRLQVQRVSMSLRELSEALKAATPETHITSGWSEREKAVALCQTTMEGLAPPERAAFIGLTKDYIDHRDGPGLMVFDTDGAYGPQVVEAFLKAAPGLAGASRIVCSSTGSFIYREGSNERIDKSQGQHTMFGVVDALDEPHPDPWTVNKIMRPSASDQDSTSRAWRTG